MGKINNKLLEEIKRQNLELRSSMESFQVGGKPTMNALSTGLIAPLNPSYQDSLSTHLKSLLAEDTGFAGDEEDFSDNEDNSDDDDDDDVFNTTNRTDVTYRPGSPDNSIYDDDFATGPNSRETTPVREIDTAMTALSSCLVTSTGTPTKVHDLLLRTPQKSLRCSTPIKELKTTMTPRRLSTPRSCAEDLNSSASRYNLRRTPVRVGIQSAAAVSAALDQESPEVFARVVKKQQQVTRRNAAKWNQALRNHQGADFSSDEQ